MNVRRYRQTITYRVLGHVATNLSNDPANFVSRDDVSLASRPFSPSPYVGSAHAAHLYFYHEAIFWSDRLRPLYDFDLASTNQERGFHYASPNRGYFWLSCASFTPTAPPGWVLPNAWREYSRNSREPRHDLVEPLHDPTSGAVVLSSSREADPVPSSSPPTLPPAPNLLHCSLIL